MIWLKRLLLLCIVLAVAGAVVYAFVPQPVLVDVETVSRGPMEVAVRDDGITRIRERYVVSTPVAGRLQRIHLDVGDTVISGRTVLARMEPTDPSLLDPRELARVEARVKAAEGRLQRAESDIAIAAGNLEQARTDLDRIETLAGRGAATQRQLEQARLDVRTQTEALRSAEFQKEIAEYELEQEKAARLHVSGEGDPAGAGFEFEIVAPITGRVLRVIQESAAVLQAGAQLLELGDPDDLEVVVDVLSSDAVRVEGGQRAWLEHWGGEHPLEGVVRLVEPSGFTKISALGVEEQRVNVIIDFTGPQKARRELGDNYRVEARIIVWEEQDVLTVPTGALFRSGEDWAVFVAEEGRASLRILRVGENNGLRAQVLAGLEPGEQVIVHPSDRITEGVQLALRDGAAPVGE